MEFKQVPKQYRPVPFWSWNEKLDTEETRAQIRMMDEAGIGGFFMHARGGLQTPYMGDDWFGNVDASIDEGRKRDMYPWAYDENGWPSGFGDGLVNGLGVDYQQKYLRMESELIHRETAIAACGEHYFYYEVNPFYVDTLDKKVIRKFIEVAYQPYFEKYGTEIEGFFTDEPQISRNGIPWSFVFEDEYRERYGEEIFGHLEELFLEVGDYRQTRVNFWKMVTELFSEAFMKQIYDQCEAWGVKLTGHLVLEEGLLSQLVSNGACMPHYEYMHIPGMDWLGRKIKACLTPLQVSSVAEQMGRGRVLSETFALCGHNVNFAELKGIYEWQMVHGINLLCPHLEGYSIRGIRKRDYPPAMYIQQPWWKVYGRLVDALSREGMILSEGKKQVDVLVLHPQATAWSLYNDTNHDAILALEERLLDTVRELERKHIVFHFGDEIMLERHGCVEDGRLVVGGQRYRYVIDSCCEILLPHTEKLLGEFKQTGGRIVTVEELPANEIVDHPGITYTKRIYEGFHVHYFVNTSAEERTASFKVRGEMLDIYTGELVPFSGHHTFEPWGSLMVVEETAVSGKCPRDSFGPEDVFGAGNDAAEVAEKIGAAEENIIRPCGTFRLAEKVSNCLTLDRCDYYFDGKLQEKNGYVLNICERANTLERRVQIHQDYHVMIHRVPEELYLVCETPEKFRITVNGKELKQKLAGWFVDKSMKKLDIAALVCSGMNTISFDCDFRQSDEFYENLRKAYLFESEKNKLVYDTEIEAVYLVGDFSVRTDGEWTQLQRYAVRYQGEFALDMPKRELGLRNIEQQGYPFFCGEMVLAGELEISGESPMLQIERRGVNAVKVEIGGREKWMLTSDRLSLAEFNVQGKVPVKLTLINNLRNLLGPHHLKTGESYRVGPGDFFKEACVWNKKPEKGWDEGYCFVETGIQHMPW